MHLTFYSMRFALKCEDFSAVKGATDVSSESTTTLGVEIKGVPEVTIELHLKMHMLVHWLVQKSTQNDSIKYELEETFYEKDVFGVAIDGLLGGTIKGALLSLRCGSLYVLYILHSAEQTELLTFSN